MRSLHKAAEVTSVPLGRLLTREVLVGAAINVVLNLFFAWIMFGQVSSIRHNAVMLDVLPATIVPALLMTFPVTLQTRRRLKNEMAMSFDLRLPLALPRSLIIRAPMIAVIALILVAAPVILLLWLLWSGAWNWSQLIILKLGFSLFHSAVVTTIVVLATIGENSKPTRRTAGFG